MSQVQYRARQSEVECQRVREGGEKQLEEANMIRFKNQLLIEMVSHSVQSVSQSVVP